METRFGTFWLIAASLLMSGRALAQNSPIALSALPGHVYVVRGASIRNGDTLSVEPSGLFFFGPIGPPLALVARPMLGIGGSGAGIGLALSLAPALTGVDSRTLDDDFFIGPFATVEAHVERMYGPTSWRSATYAGPQLSVSLFVLKASLGWMVDVGDHSDRHVQVALGAGF